MLISTGCSGSRAPLNDVFVGDDDRVLRLIVASCNADLTAEVEEGDTEVEITVTMRNNTRNACEDVLQISLSEPLDDRMVVDGSTGRAMEVRKIPR